MEKNPKIDKRTPIFIPKSRVGSDMVQIGVDTSRYVRIPLDAFGYLWIGSDKFEYD